MPGSDKHCPLSFMCEIYNKSKQIYEIRKSVHRTEKTSSNNKRLKDAYITIKYTVHMDKIILRNGMC